MSNRLLSRVLSALLATAVLGAAMPAPAAAGIVATDEALNGAGADADRAALAAWLARAEVREELGALGVDAGEVEARVATLSDEEVVRLAGELEAAPAGGSVLAVIGAVVVVLIVTDILGLTKVFPFTRSIR